MAKGWTDKSEFDLLKGELAATSDRGFERAIVPFLQISHPGLVTPPARKGFDRSGVDHLVWSDTPPHTLVVQCKGFEVREWELGKPQADQCIESIISFRDSGLKTKSYLLVHNRAGKQENFRPPVVAALRSLVRAGVAEHAELWDLGKLLKNSFESMFQQIRTLAHEQNVSAVRGYEAAEPELCEPLREVPLLVSTVVADQYRATGTSEQYEKAADPVEILRRVKTRFSLLVGYAGFGKTTATLRMTREGGQKTIYVPAAVFTDGINGTKEILERCIDIEPLISRAEPADQAILRKVARPAIEHFFKMDDGSFTLLLDGIDESTLFGRRGGLQHLFNSLRPVKSRVVMTVRKEYLDARMADFESSFGIVSDNQHKVRHQRITKVELLEWDDRRILALVKRYGGVLEGDAAKRITDLASAVASGEYQAFYGDIPRRPLFLRFILETVKEKGVHKVSRSSLFEEWAVLKIKRDVVRPAQAGGQRQPIASENSIDDTVELAFDVMGWASRCMTRVVDGVVELLSTCRMSEVLEFPALKGRGNTDGIVLNTLLVPVGSRNAPRPLELRFAHRAYQEFFLARYISANPGVFGAADTSAAAQGWSTANGG